MAWGKASWQDVTKLLGDALPGTAVSIVNSNPEISKISAAFSHLVDPDYVRSYREHYVNLDPWLEQLGNARSKVMFISERDSPSRLFHATEFYNDWMRPQGNFDAAASTRIEAGIADTVFVTWHYDLARAAVYDPAAAELLTRLRPQFEAAVRDAANVRDLLDGAQSLGAVMEHIQGAAFLVDRDLRIREVNPDGTAILQKGEVAQAAGNILSLADAQAQRWLEETVERLSVRAPVQSTSMVFADANRILRVTASLLGGQSAATPSLLIAPKPLVLVVLKVLVGGRLRIDHAALRTAFGLSSAEIRLCEILINGGSLAEAARVLGLSDGTVRQRVKMIFHKTHTHRQGELVAALGTFATPE